MRMLVRRGGDRWFFSHSHRSASSRDAASVFAFLYALVDIFKGYFDEDFDEDSLRDNFTLVYELLDGAYASWGLGGSATYHVPRLSLQRCSTTATPRTAASTC